MNFKEQLDQLRLNARAPEMAELLVEVLKTQWFKMDPSLRTNIADTLFLTGIILKREDFPWLKTEGDMLL